MKDEPVILDERVVAVTDRSYRLAYLVLSFGVMVAVAVRAWAFSQQCWDLLGLLMISGGVATVYQRNKHVRLLSRRLILLIMLIAMAVSVATAVAMVLLKR